MTMMRWMWAPLLAAGCAGETPPAATPAAETPPAETAAAATSNYRMRSCRNDALYVDVPVNVPVLWTNTTFVASVAQDLALAANLSAGAWFCGYPGCSTAQVNVRWTSVLAPRPNDPIASDAGQRFFRFWFETGRTRLTLTPAAACSAVSTLRSAFAARSGTLWSRSFYTGRECDVLPMSAEGAASPEMLSWHLSAIGLASTPPVPSAPAAAGSVDIALIDSGVSPGVAAGIGAQPMVELSNGGPLHPHGTALSILLRQVAPEAQIHDLRVLGTLGHSTSLQLARALEQALFGTGTAPLIVNLSLGWPAGLSQAAGLSGLNCSTHEDPFGEPIRYLLDVARRKDDSGARRVAVFAAAGNLAVPSDPALFYPINSGSTVSDCAAKPPGTPYFFPAEWDRVSSCGPYDPTLRRGALAIGAIDERGGRAAVTAAGAEPPLVAPGQNVTVTHPGAPAPPAQPACGTNVQPLVPELPAALSGSSVGTALVSAAAARAQALRIVRGLPPLPQVVLSRLLYLSGLSVGRATPSGTPVRRLDVARLERASTSSECAGLQTCGAGADPVPAGLLHACRASLATCGLEQLDTAGNLIPNVPSMPNAPLAPPDAGYTPTACVTASIAPVPFTAASCGGACPHAQSRDRHLLGALGPQPPGNGCPWCYGVADVTAARLKLVLELSTKFPTGTTFGQPWLKVKGVDAAGAVVGYYFDLSTSATAAAWKPGQALWLTLDTAAVDVDWSTARGELWMSVLQPGQSAAVDVSPVVITTH